MGQKNVNVCGVATGNHNEIWETGNFVNEVQASLGESGGGLKGYFGDSGKD